MTRKQAQQVRRTRLKDRFCDDCENMDKMEMKTNEAIKEIKTFLFWSIGILFTIFIPMGFVMIDVKAENANHVTKEELSYYVGKDEMVTFFIKEMKVIQKILLMRSANVPDSLVNHVFEQNEWLLQQMGDVNPRGTIYEDKDKYSDILKEYVGKE